MSPRAWWALTPPSHPCRQALQLLRRLFSSARSDPREPLPVRKRNALCCPDFPLASVGGQRQAGSLFLTAKVRISERRSKEKRKSFHCLCRARVPSTAGQRKNKREKKQGKEKIFSLLMPSESTFFNNRERSEAPQASSATAHFTFSSGFMEEMRYVIFLHPCFRSLVRGVPRSLYDLRSYSRTITIVHVYDYKSYKQGGTLSPSAQYVISPPTACCGTFRRTVCRGAGRFGANASLRCVNECKIAPTDI